MAMLVTLNSSGVNGQNAGRRRRERRRESDTGITGGIVLRSRAGAQLVSLNQNGTFIIVSLSFVIKIKPTACHCTTTVCTCVLVFNLPWLDAFFSWPLFSVTNFLQLVTKATKISLSPLVCIKHCLPLPHLYAQTCHWHLHFRGVCHSATNDYVFASRNCHFGLDRHLVCSAWFFIGKSLLTIQHWSTVVYISVSPNTTTTPAESNQRGYFRYFIMLTKFDELCTINFIHFNSCWDFSWFSNSLNVLKIW